MRLVAALAEWWVGGTPGGSVVLIVIAPVESAHWRCEAETFFNRIAETVYLSTDTWTRTSCMIGVAAKHSHTRTKFGPTERHHVFS